MTTRNFRVTYWLFASLSLVLLLGAILLAIRIGTDKRLPFFLADSRLYTEYFFLGAPVGIQLAAVFEICGLAVGVTALLTLVLFTFQKTTSMEVYLLVLWLFLADIETLRLLMLIIAQRNTSIGALVSLSRVVYGARFAGIIALFISGLYAVGVGHERPQTAYLIALLGGAVLAMLLPISIDRFQASFMLQTGYRDITMVVTVALVAINGVDYLVAARQKEDPSYAWVGIELTAAAAAWIWLWDTRPLGWGLAAVLFFVLCVVLAIKRLHAIYIWK